MPWTKVDDRLHAHPKARKAGLEALGLHLLAMSYAGAYPEDGRVMAEFVTEKAGRRAEALIGRLVESGLWEMDEDGIVIHDWLDYNPSRAEVEEERAKRSAAGKAAAQARWERT